MIIDAPITPSQGGPVAPALCPTQPAIVVPWIPARKSSLARELRKPSRKNLSRKRAIVTASLVIAPSLVLMEQAMTSPELEPVRSWSAQAQASARMHWQHASEWADGLLSHR